MAGESGLLLRSITHLAHLLHNPQGRELKRLGAEMGEAALVENDPAFVEVSVVAYSVHKVLDKPYLAALPEWEPVRQHVITRVEAAVDALKSARAGEVVDCLRAASEEVDHFTITQGRFPGGIALKARVKLAADIYAHGASLGRAAELSGAPKQDVLSYLGVTALPGKYPVAVPVSERMSLLRGLFSNGGGAAR